MSELHKIRDARHDMLCTLNLVTDYMVEKEPCMESAKISYLLSKGVKDLAKSEKIACELMGSDQYRAEPSSETCHEGWGEVEAEARKLFEALEHHYIGYYKSKAMHKRTRCEASKARMLEHLEHQLEAHDELAMYVKSHCTDCTEERAIVMNWVSSKK